MHYQKRKEITVVIAIAILGGVLSSVPFFGEKSSQFNATLSIAAVLSAFVAIASIVWSQQLDKKRRSRRIFIIYAREDIETARELEQALRAMGFNPWLDVNEILPGQVWQKVVLNALEESSLALVLVSKNLSKKGFVQKELDASIKTLQEQNSDMSPVIPIRLDDSEVPESLKNVQWVNLSDENGMQQLFTSLKKTIG